MFILNIWVFFQVVLRVCSLAGPEQKIRAGGQEPQSSGSHQRTASRGRQNQSWGVTLHGLCQNPPDHSECLSYCAYVNVHADVARVHEEGDGLFNGILQRFWPPENIYHENHHYMSQCRLVSHKAPHSVQAYKTNTNIIQNHVQYSQVLYQLCLLWAFHGSTEIWGQHLSYPNHLWSSGYTSQSRYYNMHEHVRTKTISMWRSCTGWHNDTH